MLCCAVLCCAVLCCAIPVAAALWRWIGSLQVYICSHWFPLEHCCPMWINIVTFWAALGADLVPFGPTGLPLGCPWVTLRWTWAPFGCHWGRLCALWGSLGCLWVPLGCLGAPRAALHPGSPEPFRAIGPYVPCLRTNSELPELIGGDRRGSAGIALSAKVDFGYPLHTRRGPG